MQRARAADLQLARRHGAQRARRAGRGHGAQRVRRDAKPARLPLSVTATAVTPSPPGKGLGCVSSGGAPLRSPRFAHACVLRLRGKRRRPPAEADGGYSCSSGHAPLRRTVPVPTCPSMPTDKPWHARQAHHPARNEGGPPVPPDRRRTTGTAPKVAPSRPREEANSLAQHEVPPSTQAARGPGAAMVLSQIGCHRAPFGSFPRVGKNAPHARAAGKSPSRHQAQPKAHHPAPNEGGPPVPPGRQRTTGITLQGAPSRPREEGISLAPHEVPPPSQAARGPGAAMVLAQIGCPRSPFGSFPRVGKNAPHARATGKSPSRHQAQPKAHYPACHGQGTHALQA